MTDSTPSPSPSTYAQANVAHETDHLTPLQHGVIRYVPTQNVPLEIRQTFPVKNDRSYIFVPAGYLCREPRFMENILEALSLQMPNLVVVTAETEGTKEDQMATSFVVRDPASHSLAKEWTEPHCKEVLQSKVEELLQSTMESCVEVGAWLMPQTPRRRNGAAQMICQALPPVGSPVVLGVLGLDDEDEADGLKETITSNMEPLGSPLKSVSAVDYDPNIKDGAPCPQLTHILIFESPNEMQIFRQKLLCIVPDLLLAFGDLTEKGFKSLYDSAVDGSPVIILRHTSRDVDNLYDMFKHVKVEMKKMRASGALITSGSSPSLATTGTTTTRIGGAKIRIPPMQNMDDQMINLFVSTWPTTFDSASVVLADPLLLTGSEFQKRTLAAITASFDLKTGNADMRQAKRGVLDYAWSFHDIANKHAGEKKKSSESLHIQLVGFTLISIVASVLYDQIFGGGDHPSSKNPIQLTIFVATIILPLYITSLKKESDTNNPIIRWNAFRLAAAEIESEIFIFRAQVGHYRATEKTEQAMREPLTAFVEKTRDLWRSIGSFLADDGMNIPDNFWEGGSPIQLDSIQSLSNADTAVDTTAAGLSIKSNGKFGGWLHDSTTTPRQVQDEIDIEAPPTENTPFFENLALASEHTATNALDEDDEITEAGIKPDDHYAPITAEEYIEIRMKKKMTLKSEELTLMVSRSKNVSKAIRIVTMLSGATAALSLQWMVPIILGLTASFGSGQEFRKYTKRIEAGNSMVIHLNELKLWWMGLSMYQKQLPHNKDKLIQESERIIVSEISRSFT